MLKFILVCALLASIALTQTPPIFPEQYELAFSEKASIGPIGGNTTGKIFYDATHNR